MGAGVVVLSHESALAMWRSEKVNEIATSFRPVMPGEVGEPSICREEIEALADRYGLDLPLQVTVLTAKQRRNGKRLHCHIHNERLLFAYVEVEPGVAVAVPELVLLQMASKLNAVELTLLASELSGFYALYPASDDGFIQRSAALVRDSVLRSLLDSAAHVKGRRTFSLAIDLLVRGARSPMEAILALLLCLPVDFGGCGLEKPQMNPLIMVNSSTFGQMEELAQGKRYGDLVWPEQKLIVEYDSKANHDDYARDTSRANQLMANGWTVITALPADVFDVKRCNRLAGNIAAVLGSTPDVLPVRFSEKQAQLRSDLFTASGTHCSENRNWVSAQ